MGHPRARHLWIALVTILVAGGCASVPAPFSAPVTGSGRVISEGRAVETFSAVDVIGPMAVHITAGVEPTVTVTADDNLVPMVTTTVTGDHLVIRLPSNTSIAPTAPITVAVGVPSLAGLSGEAASRTTFDRVASPDLAIRLDAASQATGTGQVGHLAVQASAASSARLAGVTVERVDLVLKAASSTEVTATQSVRGEAHDASVVRVHGNPPVVRVDVSEISRVVSE